MCAIRISVFDLARGTREFGCLAPVQNFPLAPTRNFHSFLFNKNCIPKPPFSPLPKFLVGRSLGHQCWQIVGR